MLAFVVAALLAAAPGLTAHDPKGAPEAGNAFVVRYGPPPLEVRCDAGRTVRLVDFEPPPAALTWLENGSRPDAEAYPVTIAFEAAPDGRLTNVQVRTRWVDRRGFERGTSAEGGPPPVGVVVTPRAPSIPLRADQLEASVATWRASPGSERRTGCRFELHPEAVRLAAASREDLLDLGHDPGALRAALGIVKDRAVHDRNCNARRPANLAFPDAARLPPGAPGRTTWAVLSYDLDASGRPTNLRTVRSSGDRALSEAWGEALAGSRYHPGRPAEGCLLPVTSPAALLASERVDAEPHEDPERRCLEPPPGLLSGMRSPAYPPRYLARSIEGRALVRLDVTPDGQVRNVRAVAVDPGWSFAAPAEAVVRSAKGLASEKGYEGCLVPVRFVLPEG